jgi:hypothetical protein
LVQYTKFGGIYQMTTKLPNGLIIYQHFPFPGPSIYTEMGLWV